MKVTFADQRPQGSYALAIPVRGEDMLNDRLAGLDEAARRLAARSAEAQRFEREAGAVAEAFVQDGDQVRRVLLVGLGSQRDEPNVYEKAGGALTSRLLLSGETRLVVDLTGFGTDSEAAARDPLRDVRAAAQVILELARVHGLGFRARHGGVETREHGLTHEKLLVEIHRRAPFESFSAH